MDKRQEKQPLHSSSSCPYCPTSIAFNSPLLLYMNLVILWLPYPL